MKNNLQSDIGQTVKRMRRKRGLHQKQLAALLGLNDHTSISKLESGKWNPSAQIISKIADALNMKAVIIFEDTLPS